jgi:hypothetical protein
MKWLKGIIKRDVISFLITCFLIGAALIWLLPHFTGFKLSDDARINDTVLWLTSLAIFWYAFETYQLKKNTTEQVRVQEDIMLNEFLPILEPIGQAALSPAGLKNMYIRNLGKGPAKYIKVYIGKEKIVLNWSLAGGEQESISLEAGARRQVNSLLNTAPGAINVKIKYQDIYKRRFQTENVIFDRTGRGKTYRLRQGTWDFKRL